LKPNTILLNFEIKELTRDWSLGQSSSGVEGASVDHPEFCSSLSRRAIEHNLDCWFELKEQVMLVIVVGSCSCSHMTTGSLSIGLRFVVTFQAGSQGIGYMLLFAALFVGWVDLLELR